MVFRRANGSSCVGVHPTSWYFNEVVGINNAKFDVKFRYLAIVRSMRWNAGLRSSHVEIMIRDLKLLMAATLNTKTWCTEFQDLKLISSARTRPHSITANDSQQCKSRSVSSSSFNRTRDYLRVIVTTVLIIDMQIHASSRWYFFISIARC